MPRSRSSGALSISSKLLRLAADLLGEHVGDRGGQRRLAVVDVADRADVDVRLVALELLLAHLCCSCFVVLGPSLDDEPGNTLKTPRPARCRSRHAALRLASAALDDLLRDVRRDLLVPLELHRVTWRGPGSSERRSVA